MLNIYQDGNKLWAWVVLVVKCHAQNISLVIADTGSQNQFCTLDTFFVAVPLQRSSSSELYRLFKSHLLSEDFSWAWAFLSVKLLMPGGLFPLIQTSTSGKSPNKRHIPPSIQAEEWQSNKRPYETDQSSTWQKVGLFAFPGWMAV